MEEVCDMMKPGPHCVCHDGPDEECCYCVLGLGNCRADGGDGGDEDGEEG